MSSKKQILTIVFGRFNPPTVGHERLIKKALEIAGEGELRIYPSRRKDSRNNPLDPDMKIEFLRKIFPKNKQIIINNPNMKTIFDVLAEAGKEGFSEINIVVGSDREQEFERITSKYNGILYSFNAIRVMSAGFRDPDIDGVDGMSASRLRKAVENMDLASFRSGTPISVSDYDARIIFDAVRKGMGLIEPDQ